MRSGVVEPGYPPGRTGESAIHYPANQPSMSRTAGRPPAQVQRRSSTARNWFVPEEGWLALLFLAVALYCVVFSVISADWIPMHGQFLLISPAIGLLVGVTIAKIPRLPQALLHLAACLVGHWLSIWVTSVLAYHVNWLLLLSSLRTAFTGGMASAGTLPLDGEVVFFFYLSFLCFFLGYFGSWLIYRAHLPWLVALVYSSILLVNLNYARNEPTYLIFILAAALLLLVARVQLVAQIQEWKKEGLHTDHAWIGAITARCMKIASILCLFAVLGSMILPISQQPISGKTFWDSLDNIWSNVVNGHISLNDPGAMVQPYQTPTNFFGDQMTISGSVHLPNGEVLYYTTNAPGMHYLEGFTYNHFDGHSWTSSLYDDSGQINPANNPLPPDIASLDVKNYADASTAVTIVQPPESGRHFIFAPPQPTTFSVPVVVYGTATAGAWTQTVPLSAHQRYTVRSSVLVASAKELAQVALPDDDITAWQLDDNYEQLRGDYLQLPTDLSQHERQVLHVWTQGAKDAYSALRLLEAHLSNSDEFTYSQDNAPVPNTMDAVDWLLQSRRGYCTYYATAMAVMGRQLNIPTRVVNGFSRGTYDSQRKVWSVSGSDAHSWVQAYLPGFGWVDFDPTPGYIISRPGSTTPLPSPTVTPSPAATPHSSPTPAGKKSTPVPPQRAGDTPQYPDGSGSSNLNQVLFTGVTMVLVLLALLILLFSVFSRWWRKLYAGSTPVAGLFWRLCRIAAWAGLPPRHWQTPYEYSRMLSQYLPQKSAPLHSLTDLFVRERYGPQQPFAHSEQIEDIQSGWPALRNSLLRLFIRKR